MSFKKSAFLILILSFISNNSLLQAVFFSGERFVNMQGNTIDCFADVHLACNDELVAMQQQQDLVHYAQQISHSCIIVEDMLARYAANTLTMPWKFEQNITTPLDNLSVYCSDLAVPCCNIEFREASAASLAGCAIPACKTLASFNNVANEIARYRDNPLLNAYYWNTIATVLHNNRHLLDTLAGTDDSLQDYCRELSESTRDSIDLFDISLIDARIIHAIYQNRLKKNLFVCAGFHHIENIRPLLLAMGYRSLGVIENHLVLDRQEVINKSSAVSIAQYFDQRIDSKIIMPSTAPVSYCNYA